MSGGLLTPIIGKQTFRDVLGGGRDITGDNPLATTPVLGTSPVLNLIYESAVIDNELRNILVEGGYLYLTEQANKILSVWDVGNPYLPVKKAELSTASIFPGHLSRPLSILKRENYLYLTIDYDGIAIIDVSNPLSPTIKSSLADRPYLEFCHGEAFFGTDYLVAIGFSGDSVVVINISNPASPAVTGRITDHNRLDGVHAVAVVGNYAYVVSHYGGGGQIPGYLTTLDLTDPAAPTIYDSILTDLEGCHIIPTGKRIDGKDYLLAGGGRIRGGGFYCYEIVDNKPSFVCGIDDVGGYFIALSEDKNFAFVVDGANKLSVVDVGEIGVVSEIYPRMHKLQGWFGNVPLSTSTLRNVFVNGDYVYVSANGKLVIFKILWQKQWRDYTSEYPMLLHASKAETATVTGFDVDTPNMKAANFYLDVTAVAGVTSPTLDVKIQEKDKVSGKYFDIVAFTQKTAIGSERKSYGRGSGELIGKAVRFVGTIPSNLIEDCEDAWDEQAVAGVTSEADTGDKMVGSASAKLTMTDGAAAGVLASEVVSLVGNDLDNYNRINLWVKSSIDVAADQLQILLDDTANCASPVATINLPALTANTWTLLTLTTDFSGCTALTIISVGVKQVSDLGAFTLWLDEIRAVYSFTYSLSMVGE